MSENLHGKYERSMAELQDFADGGERKRTEAKNAVNHLLSLSHHKPKQAPLHENPLVAETLRMVRG